MNAVTPITDDEIQVIVATTTMADFRAALVPWQDDPAARKKITQKLRTEPRNYFNWQRTESLRLYAELQGAEPNAATVLQAEVTRFNSRLAGKEFASVNGLTLEYEAGFLEEIEKRVTPRGKQVPDVHKVVMDEIAAPARAYILYDRGRIKHTRATYNDVRMTISRGADGKPVFAVWSQQERDAEAELKRQTDARARQVAEIPDLAAFIAAVTAEDTKFRKLIKEQLAGVADDAQLAWQKREVFGMLNRGETPDVASLQIGPRVAVALDDAKLQFEQQFKKAVKHVPVIAGTALRRKLGEVAFDDAARSVRQVVNSAFVNPVSKWVRENWESVSAQAQKFPDTQIIVDDLPPPGETLVPRLFSARDAMNQWMKVGVKTTTAIAAPRTASFRRAPKPVT